MLTIILNVALSIWIFMSLFFLLAVIKKDNSIVDIGWGLGFVIITIIALLQGSWPGLRGIVYLFVILWGLRLSVHIFLRTGVAARTFAMPNGGRIGANGCFHAAISKSSCCRDC